MTAPPAAIQPESLPRLVGEGIALAASAQGPVLTVAPERLHQVCAHLREEPDCCFDFLADFTAVSHPEPLRVVFRLWSTAHSRHVQVVVPLGSELACPSITGYWPAAGWQEREVYDLFGIRFPGHPDLRRILLAPDWVGHPLLPGEVAAPELGPPLEPAPGALGPDQTVINVGPQHPSTHGVLRLVVTLSGEEIVEVDPVLGYLHRGIEKLAESRTYAQVIPYTDRLDYVSGVLNNWPYVLAAERLAGIAVPPRAEFIRVVLGELCRVASHLLWLACFANDLGATSVFLYGFRERELILDLLEEATGARLTNSFFRLGGVPYDLPEGFADRARGAARVVRARLQEYDSLFTRNRIFLARAQGVGVLTAEQALAWGVSGPMARASGVAQDVRRSDPYSVYPELEFEVALEKGGDVLARLLVRMEEMRQSLRIMDQALASLPPGPVMAKVPRQLKPEPGDAYAHIESARGDYGVYLVSDGSAHPARVRFRSPSFANLQVLPLLARGWKVADLIAILGAIDIILGEVDR